MSGNDSIDKHAERQAQLAREAARRAKKRALAAGHQRPVMEAESMRKIAASYEDQHKAELAKLNANISRDLSVRLGEHFLAAKVDTDELIGKWARGGHTITKKEFRQYIRDLLDTNRTMTNPVEIDSLFDEFSPVGGEDKGDAQTIEVRDIRHALKKYHSTASKAAEDKATTRARSDHFWQRAEAAMKAIEVTLAYEHERDGVDGRDHTFRDRLELKLARKEVKANELVTKFGGSSGNFTKAHFLSMMVTIMGEYDAQEEDSDALFAALDEDSAGILDAKKMRQALQTMIAAGKKGVENHAKLEEALLVQLDGVYVAQSTLRAMLDEDSKTGLSA